MEKQGYKNRLTDTASLFVIIALLIALIYLAHEILFPFIMALLIAILLRPVVVFFNAKLRLPNVIAVLLAVLLSIVIAAGIVFFISREISSFMNDLPTIKANLNTHFHHIQQWLNKKFNISYRSQKNYITQIKETGISGTDMISGSMLNSFTGKLFNTVLVFVYTFLMLLYRTLFFNFFIKLIPKSHHTTLREILFEIKVVIRGYLIGLATELGIVAVLVSAGLWIVGVEYFAFLGMMTAILNLIPYIGVIIATVISVFIALISSTDLAPVLGVVIINAVVHIVDANIISPRIVASKVSINAMASISGVVIAGTLAGVAGMFLAIPVIAIIKVIFDRIEPLKPWGYLLGDDMPKNVNWLTMQLPEVKDEVEKNPAETLTGDEAKTGSGPGKE